MWYTREQESWVFRELCNIYTRERWEGDILLIKSRIPSNPTDCQGGWVPRRKGPGTRSSICRNHAYSRPADRPLGSDSGNWRAEEGRPHHSKDCRTREGMGSAPAVRPHLSVFTGLRQRTLGYVYIATMPGLELMILLPLPGRC